MDTPESRLARQARSMAEANTILRKIAAHVPAKVWIAAKEAAGYGTEVRVSQIVDPAVDEAWLQFVAAGPECKTCGGTGTVEGESDGTHGNRHQESCPDCDGVRENPCAKIFDHKWLDPQCVESGCQSLAIAVASNYVADDEVYPKSVKIAGRTIRIVTREGKTFLDISGPGQ
jgi:hypothetical protein